MKSKNWLTVAEIADEFDVSPRTVRNWYHRGLIEGARVGPKLLRISSDSLERIATP